MTVFVPTGLAPRLDLHILRRDFFDGFSLLLQDADDQPIDLTNVTVCASVWKPAGTTRTKVLDINVERQEPLNQGRIRLWLSSSQTGQIWDAYGEYEDANVISFESVHSANTVNTFASPLFWDVRIETQEELADLVSVTAGAFVTQTNHTLGSSERAIFKDTSQSLINYGGTSATIYSGLTNISYQAPYSFTIASLSGITNAALGGSVYRLRQDTVVAGNVIVGSTVSNCFP